MCDRKARKKYGARSAWLAQGQGQRICGYYGLFEAQFMRCFHEAARKPGNTGEILLSMLERRLDNAVYKLNFAPSRKGARELIAHGHIYVNGRKVNIASYMLKVGDKITIKKSDKSLKCVKEQLATNPNFSTQSWLQLNADKPEATIVAMPTRDDVQIPVEEQLVVEFCSK
jgi:small subunit ribosomal protein S4